MKNWWKTLTDEGQLLLISLGITLYSWMLILGAMLACYCFGYAGMVDKLLECFKAETWAVGGVLTVFLTHSGATRCWGKVDNMKDIVSQSDLPKEDESEKGDK